MTKSWEEKIQEDFPFMKQTGNKDDNIYRRWGFEGIGDGWNEIIYNCCKQISDAYKAAGIEQNEIDFVPLQIKQKFAQLRFYYTYTDSSLNIGAIDFLGSGSTIRFSPENEEYDSKREELRRNIKNIVRDAEEKSKHTCEICSNAGTIRKDLLWKMTLCDSCYHKRLKLYEESKKKRANCNVEDYKE